MVTIPPPGMASPPALVDRDAVRGQLEALAQQLVWVQRAAERGTPASPELLTRMQREVGELQRQILTAPAPVALPPPPPRHELGDGDGDGERGPGWGPRPMRPDAFGALIGAVRNEHFDENRLRIAGEAATRNWFAVDQVVQLVETCSFSEGKLHMLELVAPHLIDRRNDFVLLQAFRFDDDKAKAQEILARTPPRR
jgi:hypothetical protein